MLDKKFFVNLRAKFSISPTNADISNLPIMQKKSI